MSERDELMERIQALESRIEELEGRGNVRIPGRLTATIGRWKSKCSHWWTVVSGKLGKWSKKGAWWLDVITRFLGWCVLFWVVWFIIMKFYPF